MYVCPYTIVYVPTLTTVYVQQRVRTNACTRHDAKEDNRAVCSRLPVTDECNYTKICAVGYSNNCVNWSGAMYQSAACLVAHLHNAVALLMCQRCHRNGETIHSHKLCPQWQRGVAAMIPPDMNYGRPTVGQFMAGRLYV